jgi:hypothetical protein
MNNEQQIRETLQTYIDSMYESSAEKARVAFHPNAKVTGYLEDGLHEMTTEDFAGFVAAQQPSPKDKGETIELEILSIDIAGDTAAARIRDNYLGLNFLDSISLLKSEGRWSIYNKLFHVEGPAG